jgi:Mrp family chromosome partitioning ATPase
MTVTFNGNTSFDPIPSRSPLGDRLHRTRMIAGRYLAFVVLLMALAGAAAAFGTMRLVPEQHVSSVTFIVRSNAGANASDMFVRTLEYLAQSEPVAAGISQRSAVDVSAETLVRRLEVNRPPGGAVMTVSYSDGDAYRSREVMRALVPVFAAEVTKLTQPAPGETAPSFALRTWGSGPVDTEVVHPPVSRNTILGVVLGALLGLVVVILRIQRHPPVASAAQAGTAVGLPVLASLPALKPGRRHLNARAAVELMLVRGPLVGLPEQPRRLLVMGPSTDSERTAFVLELARALAAQHRDVILVDADLGNGRLSRALGLQGRPGLGECLAGQRDTSQARMSLEELGVGELQVVPAGKHRANRVQRSLAACLNDLPAQSVVIVDAPPLADAHGFGELAEWAGEILVVVSLGRTRVGDALVTGDALGALPRRPAAVVVLDSEWFEVPSDHGESIRPARRRVLVEHG